MLIRCKIERDNGIPVNNGSASRPGTRVTFGAKHEVAYDFAPNKHGHHVCDVENKEHVAKFLSIPEGYEVYEAPKEAPKKAADEEAEPSPYDSMSKEDMLAEIERMTGSRPAANTSVKNLRKALQELDELQASQGGQSKAE